MSERGEESTTSNEKPGGVEEEGFAHEDEMADADDRVVGIAFRRSVLVLIGVGLVVVAAFLIFRRSEEQAPEQKIVTAPPETVTEVATAPDVRFTDLAAAAGVGFVHANGAYGDKLLPETMGGGVALFDYDGDGDDDLLLVNSTHWPHHEYGGTEPHSALYRNEGDFRFTDVSRETGLDLDVYGMGVAIADYDGDGDRDVFLTAVGPNVLLRNDRGDDGEVRFTEVTSEAGVAGAADQWSSTAGFFDYDGDGDLDLFVCNYVRWSKEVDFELDFRLTGVGRGYGPPQSYAGAHPYLYRNDGDGRFADVSAEAGIQIANRATGVPIAKALALGLVDVDVDGDIDVFVANDTVRNFLFRNQGDGTFVEQGESFGVAYDSNGNATGAMGVDAGYYRNDRNLGFMIANFANEMSSVYVAQDDPEFFVDEAIGEGIGAPSRRKLSFGMFLFDYDLDGRLDLLQSNGHIEDEIEKVDPSQSYRQPGQLFWNAGDRGFVHVEASTTGDLAKPIVGRGSAFGDLDGDGDLDVVLTQVGGPPLLLRNEQATGHHWLRLRLSGKAPNRDAIGAWVEVRAGGVTQRRQVMPTRSYLSQVEPTLTFGLGQATTIDSLVITWPDHGRQVVEAVDIDQLKVIAQD